MIRSKKYFTFIFLSAFPFLFSCNPTQRLQEGEYLLVKNHIRIKDQQLISTQFDYAEMMEYVKQKPNRKIFGLFRFHLWIYNKANRGKVSDEIREIVGEPPVVYSRELTDKSSKQLTWFLKSRGFFHATVADSTYFYSKKAAVTYILTPGTPFFINNISYNVSDSAIAAIVFADSVNGVLKPGIRYSEEKLQEERERITLKLKNSGYYSFNKEYIRYIADSFPGSRTVNLEIRIGNPIGTDAPGIPMMEGNHRKYFINNVSFYYDFNLLKPDIVCTDTILFGNLSFIGTKRMAIKPQTLTQKLMIHTGDYYQYQNVENTYKFLNGLQVFKFVNFQFKEAGTRNDSDLLDCNIQLTQTPFQSFAFETEGTHDALGAFGLAGNLVYRNKNIFRGAELFEFRIKAAMETQKTFGGTEPDVTKKIPFFNTLEVGPEANLKFPKFLLPVSQQNFSAGINPRTTITLAQNYQIRPEYTRTLLMGSLGYEWSNINVKKHISRKQILQPASVNVIKLIKLDPNSDIFKSTNDFIRNSYIDHLIASSGYTYIFSDQDIKKVKPFTFYKLNLEFAGNTLWGLRKTLKLSTDISGQYKIFEINFAQYARVESDYRYFFPLNEHNMLVMRGFMGIGVPYGNSIDMVSQYAALPFEKSFFGGGANDNRAWFARTLGPGSWFGANRLNRTGDLKLMGNIECRADVYKMFKAAFFVDMGNIWMLDIDPSRENANFEFTEFPGEIAFGTGAGLRMDPGFFILRIDIGYPVKEPEAPSGERWVFQSKSVYNDLRTQNGMGEYKARPTVNFAIGYPF